MNKWLPCNFIVSNFPTYINPSYALIAKSQNGTYFDSDDSTFIVALNTCYLLSAPSQSQLFTAQWLEDEIRDRCCGSHGFNQSGNLKNRTVHVHITPFFRAAYDVDLKRRYFVRQVTPIPLERVTFGTDSEDAFRLYKNENWNTELIVAACANKILCCQGRDLLLKSPAKGPWGKLSVLECQPVLQGIISVQTEVVVVLVNDMAPEVSSEVQNKVYHHSQSSVGGTDFSLAKYWTLLHYTGNLILPYSNEKITGLNPVLSIMAKAFALMHSLKTTLRVHICPVSPFNDFDDQSDLDCLNTVIVSKELARQLSLSNKDWVKISILSESKELITDEETTRTNFRCAQVYFEDSCKPSNAYFDSDESIGWVSPQLWFNLNQHPSPLLKSNAEMVLQKLEKPDRIDDSFLRMRKLSPLYATEVMIALVQSPGYDAADNFVPMCDKYFSTPRYVKLGDIICIGCTSDPSLCNSGNNPSQMESTMIHFKVSKICGPESELPGYLMDNKHSNLYQVGTVFSFTPKTMDVYSKQRAFHNIWHNPTPAGIDKYVNVLQPMVEIYTNSVVRKQTAPLFLLIGPSGIGKQTVLRALSRRLNMQYQQINCLNLVGDSSSATQTRLEQVIKTGPIFAPSILVLRNIHFLTMKKEFMPEDPRVLQSLVDTVSSTVKNTEFPLIIIGTSTDINSLPMDVMTLFVHHIKMEQPDESERMQILNALVSSLRTSPDVSIESLAENTKGFLLGDMCRLVSTAIHTAYERILKSCSSHIIISNNDEEDICSAGVFIHNSDFIKSLDEMRADFSDAIGAPKIPKVRWEDVGGLQEVKDAIMDTVLLPLYHPELISSGLRRSGILLFGPPGTGKTLLAKAVATECKLQFLSVKGPELLGMYVGESEENVRRVFQTARSVAPCIVFFDELDSLVPKRGRNSDSSRVMDRVVSQLLAEIDGLDKGVNVFVIGATNRPDLVDPGLLRPGRFDKILYVGVGDDRKNHLKILEAQTRKFHLAPDVSLEKIVSLCPKNMTGADFHSVCSEALLRAISRCVDDKNYGKEETSRILVLEAEDFENAVLKFVPSVSLEELRRFEMLQKELAN